MNILRSKAMTFLTEEEKTEKEQILWDLQNKKNEVATLMRKIEYQNDMKSIDKILAESRIWQTLIK